MKIAVLVLLVVSQVALGAKPNYTYHVRIDDPAEANFQEKQETRVLEKAAGSYSVLEPNGALRTVTYTADEEGFKPVITYTYGHPVAPVKKVVPAKAVVAAAPAALAYPAPVFAQPIRQVVAQPVAQVVSQPIRQVVARPAVPLQVAAPVQKVVAAPAAFAVPSGGYLPPPQPVVPSGGYSYPVPTKVFNAAPAQVIARAPVAVAAPAPVAIARAPVAIAAAPAPIKKVVPIGGGYSYGISSADHYGLSYGSPGFSYHATRTYSHAPAVAAVKVAQPVAVSAPARLQVAQPAYYAAQAPVRVAQQVAVAAPRPVAIAQPVYQQQIVRQQVYNTAPAIHTVQPAAQLSFAAPAPLQFPVSAPASTVYASQGPIPQIAYGAPQFTVNSISTATIAQATPAFAYAPQHVTYAPAPAVKQVQLAQPQIQLAQLAQAQVNYVAQQPTVQLAAAQPAPVLSQQVYQSAQPVVQKQVVAAPVVAGNGLRISGNAFAVPAASGNKNPLTFEYSYGDGASKVSHSYSGSGW